jgi:hypothetical protein
VCPLRGRFDAPSVQLRLKKFSGPRKKVYYDKQLQDAKVIGEKREREREV